MVKVCREIIVCVRCNEGWTGECWIKSDQGHGEREREMIREQQIKTGWWTCLILSLTASSIAWGHTRSSLSCVWLTASRCWLNEVVKPAADQLCVAVTTAEGSAWRITALEGDLLFCHSERVSEVQVDSHSVALCDCVLFCATEETLLC